ncbi:transketolase [bacterium]|nr:transketolase [bacterium]
MDIANLKIKAKTIRRLIIEMLTEAGSGHPGGSLSCVEIITAIYFHIMQHRPTEPNWPGRDRFILSKGHCCPTLYASLALSGYFDTSHLKTLRKLGSILQGHPDMLTTPGIEVSTGSLGQGFSVACGMALSAKIDKRGCRIYVLLGDGETQEGQVWEAAMSAAHYKLGNLTAFLDYNKLQIDGRVEDIIGIEPVKAKWEAFGWDVKEINGHNFEEIIASCEKAKSSNKPSMIIAHTIKGKGVSFMEGKAEWHGVAPTKEEAGQALLEIENG